LKARLFFCARARPWTRCRSSRRAGTATGFGLDGFVAKTKNDGVSCGSSSDGWIVCARTFQLRPLPQSGQVGLRRCAPGSKVRSPFGKCASWKTPRISSKMRTLFQGAHEILRLFEEQNERGRSKWLSRRAGINGTRSRAVPWRASDPGQFLVFCKNRARNGSQGATDIPGSFLGTKSED